MDYWGLHFSADFGECDLEAIKSYDTIYEFTKALVFGIDMVAYGEPQIVNFGSDNKEGYTLVQLIETSNITAHFSNDEKSIYLDVFSCKDFDPHIVVELVKEYFKPQTVAHRFFERQA